MTFEASICFIYREEDGSLREEETIHQFVAASFADAIRSVVLLAEAETNWYLGKGHPVLGRDYTALGSVKLWQKKIQEITEDGKLETRRSLTLFEWKSDFPSSLKDWAKTYLNRAEESEDEDPPGNGTQLSINIQNQDRENIPNYEQFQAEVKAICEKYGVDLIDYTGH